jgi:hypothetical protein
VVRDVTSDSPRRGEGNDFERRATDRLCTRSPPPLPGRNLLHIWFHGLRSVAPATSLHPRLHSSAPLGRLDLRMHAEIRHTIHLRAMGFFKAIHPAFIWFWLALYGPPYLLVWLVGSNPPLVVKVSAIAWMIACFIWLWIYARRHPLFPFRMPPAQEP